MGVESAPVVIRECAILRWRTFEGRSSDLPGMDWLWGEYDAVGLVLLSSGPLPNTKSPALNSVIVAGILSSVLNCARAFIFCNSKLHVLLLGLEFANYFLVMILLVYTTVNIHNLNHATGRLQRRRRSKYGRRSAFFCGWRRLSVCLGDRHQIVRRNERTPPPPNPISVLRNSPPNHRPKWRSGRNRTEYAVLSARLIDPMAEGCSSQFLRYCDVCS